MDVIFSVKSLKTFRSFVTSFNSILLIGLHVPMSSQVSFKYDLTVNVSISVFWKSETKLHINTYSSKIVLHHLYYIYIFSKNFANC